MEEFDPNLLTHLHKPSLSSHKGENGRLLLIAGSKLFHAASIWPLTVASRIVDMVFYSSVDENNKVVESIKSEFRDGIVVPRSKIDNYAKEADCILIGPGLPREEGLEEGDDDTRALTESLLAKYPDQKWVIDGGSLQVIGPESLPRKAIITPHPGEFRKLFGMKGNEETVVEMAKKFNVVILLKGEADFVSDGKQTIRVSGGNPGMTKGGTGDVLAGLVASLYCKNDAFLSAAAASYINKKAGEALSEKMGMYFNASDLAAQIPHVMKNLL